MAAHILFAIALLALPVMAQPEPQPAKGVNFYNLEKEIALGNGLASDFRSRNRIFENRVIQDYINRIGKRLAYEIGGPPFTYTFALFDDASARYAEVAAFPGGFIFVPASLILAAQDEDELAGMLTHAIAHIASRHSTRLATREELLQVASAPLIYVGGWSGMVGAAAMVPLGMQQAVRKFELDADRQAARKMAAAGYDPAALERYVERAPLVEEGQRTQRLQAIREVIFDLPPRTYDPHQSLAPIQDEIRRIAPPPTAPNAPKLAR